MTSKRVGIVGASASGLLAAKELREVGCEVLIFEQNDNVGGVIRNSYNAMQSTASSTLFSFGCLPTGTEKSPVYWTLPRYIEYLNEVCDRFGLREHISFQRRVLRAAPTEAGPDGPRFSLTHEPVGGGKSVTECFDHLVFASGLHSNSGSSGVPTDVTKNLPGRSAFKGTVIHASQFSGPELCEGKNVVILGIGESGSDIIAQVAPTAKSSVIAARNGPGWVVSRYHLGRASDLDTSRVYHLPHKLWHIAGLRSLKVWLESLYLQTDPAVEHRDDLAVVAQMAAFNRDSGVTVPWHRYGTKNEGVAVAMVEHGTEYKRANVSGFDGDKVLFSDGSSAFCDVLICATGFDHRKEYADKSDFEDLIDPAHWFANPRELYKRVFHPDLGAGVGCIGLCRPAFGAFNPMIELQARLYAGVVAGRIRLPSTDAMKRHAKAAEASDLAFFKLDAKRLVGLTNYASYAVELSRDVGCAPPMLRLFLMDFQLWWHVFAGQLTPLQFRLFGPGRLEGARDLVLSMPMMPLPVLLLETFVYVCAWLLWLIGAANPFKTIA